MVVRCIAEQHAWGSRSSSNGDVTGTGLIEEKMNGEMESVSRDSSQSLRKR